MKETIPLLPNDWELFYIGYCGNNRCDKSVNICKIETAYCLHGYIIRNTSVVKKLIQLLNRTSACVIDNVINHEIVRGTLKAYLYNPRQLIQQYRSLFSSDILNSLPIQISPMINPLL
jgi:hypothetical protein